MSKVRTKLWIVNLRNASMGAAGTGALCGRARRGLEATPGRGGRPRGRWSFGRLGFGARGCAGAARRPASFFPARVCVLLGAGLCGAGRARAAAGAAACAGPGRAVAGGVRSGVCGACAGGVGARPRRGLRCRVSEGRGGCGYPGRRKQGRWAYACRALTL